MYLKSTKFEPKNMLLALFFVLTVFTGSLKAQLTGTKNIPGDYATLASAITALNTSGVGAGGVILNVISGNPETAPLGGYSITATGTGANQIIIQGNSNIITAPTPQASGLLNDAFFKIIGADYITITGFNMQENAANTATTAGTNNMTEFGVSLTYSTVTDGAQNISIISNTITLNRIYQNTFGIYANSTHNLGTVTTGATATGTLGGTSNLKIYSNNISNVNMGIVVVGPTAAADYNQGLDIGGSSLSQGNTISNYGTTNAISGYATVSGTVNGILVKNSGNYNISNNSVVSSNGGVILGTLNGIQIATYSNAPTIAYSQTISGNNFSLRSGIAGGAINGINVAPTNAASTSSLSITNNDFTAFGHTVPGTAAIIFITNAMPVGNLNINNNTFSNITVNTTGSVTFISHSYSIPTTGIAVISNNAIVISFNKTGAGGSVIFSSTSASSATGSINNYLNNNISNITVTGATGITGINNLDGGTGSAKTITGNLFNNWTGGTSAITALNMTYWNGASSLSGNQITNITGQAAITGLNLGSASNVATSLSVSSNTINTLSSTGAGGAVVGIACSNTSPLIDIRDNIINTLSSTGVSVVTGIIISGSTATNVFRNKIYDLSGSNAGGTAIGIASTGGTTNTIYNNTIGDLRAPIASAANALIGINITGGTTNNIYYNTVLLNGTSSGTNFGSSAISTNATPTTINLRNNIFVNNSTPNGTGISVAYRRASIVLTNYAASSNNNLFYAGVPSPTTAIFTDGTTTYSTLAAYKTAMATRDGASVTENPSFASIVGSAINFLHFNPSTNSAAESGAINIGTITNDFDTDIRQGNAGYAGLGTSPDIGADEFEGISPAPAINSVSITPIGTQCIAVSRNITANVTPGTAAITAVTLNYSFNGVAQTPITMTGGSFTSTSTWNATIPVAIPTNANVTWAVITTDGTYTKSMNGVSYKDEPLTGIIAQATASLNPICAGNTSTLMAVSNGNATLGTGIGVNTTSSFPAAYGSYWGNGRTQFLVLASELQALGLSAGNITSVGFDVTAIGTPSTLIGYTIKMAPTALAALSAFQTASLTTVYSSTYTPVVGSFASNTHLFSTPFNWNGTSNVIVDICFSNAITGTSNTITRYSSTSFNSSIYYGADGAGGAGACSATTITGGPFSLRPNMLFSGNKTGGYTFNWSDGTSSIATTNSVAVTPTVNTTYSATLTDANGCSINSSPVTVTVIPLPTTPIVSNSSQCGLGVPTASVSGGTLYNWYATPTSTAVLQTGTATNYTASISTTTTWYVTSVSGSCESSPRTPVTASVTIPDAVTASSSSSYLCLGGANTITLTATQTGTVNPYTFSWDASPVSGSGMPTSASGVTTNVTPTLPGTYTYSVTATDGICTTISSVTVALNDIPSITASANPTVICSGASVNLNAQSINASIATTTIGSGATTNSGGGSPFYHSWGGAKVQYIYTAAELAAQGLLAGNITSMGLNITSVGIPYQGFALSIGATTQSVFPTANTINGLTQVYVGTGTNSSFTPVLGVNNFVFSTPFNWDGVSNVVISICWSNATTGGTSSAVKWDTYTGNRGMYIYADSQTPSTVCSATTTIPASGGSSTTTGRPQTYFTGLVGVNVSSSMNFIWNPGAINSNTATVNPANTGTAAATQVYTATVTNSLTTCSNTATVGILVNPIPLAPVATNSTQCGVGIPTSSVSGGTSYNWYASPTSTAVLQTGSATNYTTSISATTTWYVTSLNGTCESTPRIALTSTVSIPDGVIASTSSSNLCVGGANTITLTATQTGTVNPYVFSWDASPVSGSGMPTTVNGTTTSVTPTLPGTYTYSVTATDGICTTISTVTVALNNLPTITNASATPTAICSGSTFSLIANSFAGGPQTLPTGYCTPASSGTGCLTLVSINTLSRSSLCETGFYIDVPSSSVTTDLTPGQTYTLSLTTNATAITSVWFDWNRDGVFAASEWIQPFTTGTTGSVTVLVPLSATAGLTKMRVRSRSSGNPNGSADACTSFGSGEAEDYTINVQMDISSNYTWTWNPGSLSGNSLTTSSTNTTTSTVTDVYTVTATNTITGCSNTTTTSIVVNPIPSTPIATDNTQCGIGVPTSSVSGGTLYNWYVTPTSTTVIQTGSSSNFTSSINSTTTWYVASTSGVCESPRVALTQTVVAPPVLIINAPSAICSLTGIETFSITSTISDYSSYVWTPSTNLYTDAAATIPYTGSNNSTVFIKSNIVGTNTISVLATNSVSGCANTATGSIVIKETPSALTVTPVSASVCAGGSKTITVNGGTVPRILNVGTQGGQNTATTYPSPYSVYYGGQRMQTLVLASELSAAGFSTGSPINRMQMPVVSLGANWGTSLTSLQNFQINMAATTSTSLSAFQTGLTNVLTPSNFTPVVGNNTHTFTTPFIWDGTSNIILETTFSNAITGTTADAVIQYTTSTAYQSTIQYKADGVTAVAAASATIVSNSYSSRPDFNLLGAEVGSYSWSPSIGLSTNTGTNVVATPGASTVYTVIASFNGCSSFGTSSINVISNPTVTAVSSSSTICSGSSATLTASGATSYTWSPVGGTSATAIVSPTVNATYTVTGKLAGCTSTATVDLSVIASPTISASASSNSICAGSSATLTAVGATNYTWTSGGNASTEVVTPTTTSVYTVTGESNGCTRLANVTVTVVAIPSLTATASSSAICTGSSATLTATGATNYTWTSGGTASTEVVTPTTTSVYTVTGATSGCVNTTTVSLDVNSIPTVTATASSASVCSGSTATLTASGATNYTWTSGGNASTEVVTPTIASVYTVTGETSGCSNTAIVSVGVNPSPTVTATASQTLLCDNGSTGSSILTAATTATTFAWSDGANTMTTSVTPTLTTTYTVTVTEAGCSADAFVTVTVSNCNGVEELVASGISVYPNPTNGILNISISSELEGVTSIEVYDAIGKLTIKENLTSNTTTINTSKLVDGIYVFKIINNTTAIKIGKIVKQ